MNRIFRVIWSVRAQAWVAVSELTKAHAKKSQSDSRASVKTFALSAAASTVLGVALAAVPSTVSAVVAIGSTNGDNISAANTKTTGDNAEKNIQAYNYYNPGSLSYGNASRAENGTLYSNVNTTGVAIGNNTDIVTQTVTGGKSGIAIGDYAKSVGGLSISLGALSQSTDIGAVAIGTSSLASGFNSLAMMRQSAATADYATAIGSVAWANGTGSFAIGVSATAQGNQSIAIGSTAQETVDNGKNQARSTKYNGYSNTQTNGDRSMALGSGAKTSGADSFAVGSNATTGTFRTEYNQTLQNNTMVASSAAPKAVAFGNGASAQKEASIAFGFNSISTGKDGIAFGINSNASGQGSVAFGTNAKASHDRVVAIGTNATATHNSSMAVGEDAKAYADNSLALGARAVVTAGNENSVALGNDAVVDEIGGQSNMIVNGVVYEFAGKNAKGTISIAGGDVTERTVTHVAAGRVSDSSTDAINGSQLYAVTKELNKGWNIAAAADGGNVSGNQTVQVKFGDTVTVKAGKNINVTQSAQNITVATADNVTFNNVLTRDLTASRNISSDNMTVAGNTNVNNFSVKSGGIIDMGGNVVANVAAPVNDNDSVNKKYVDNGRTVVTSRDGSVTIKPSEANNNGKSYDLSVNANLSYTADNNTQGRISLNDSIAFNGTDNEIVTSAANGGVTFKLAEAVKNALDKANSSMQSFTVGADKNGAAQGISVDQENTRFDVVGADNGNITAKVNNRTVEVDLTERTKQDIANGTTANNTINSRGLIFKTGTTSSDEIKLGETLNVNDDGNIKTAAAGNNLNITLNKDLNIDSVTAGKTKVSDGGISISADSDPGKTVSLSEKGLDNGGNKIVRVAKGELNATSTDAVNGSQLYETNQNVANNSQNIADNAQNITHNSQNITNLQETVAGGFGLADDDNNPIKAALGETVQVKGADGIKTSVKGTALEVGLSNNVTVGNNTSAGTIVIKGMDGKDGISLNGKDGSIGLTGKDGVSGTITVQQGESGVNGRDGESLTRIVYTDGNGTTHQVATMKDGLKFKGNTGEVIAKELGQTLTLKGNLTESAAVTDKNLRVDNVNGELIVKMAQSLTDLTTATFGADGDNTVINKDGVVITNAGGHNVSLTENGLNNGGNKITNIARGTDDSDAVNLEQLNEVKNTASSGWNLSVNQGENQSNIAPNATVDLNSTGNGIVISKTGSNVTFGLDNNIVVGGKDGKDGKIGVDGKDGQNGVTIYGNGTVTVGAKGENGKDGADGVISVNGKDGSAVVINGKDGSIGLNGKDGANGLTVRGEQGPAGVDGTAGESKTRIVYQYTDPNTGENVTENVSTLNDGLKFAGDNASTVIAKKLNETLTVKGNLAEDAKVADGNIRVDAENGALVLKLATDLTNLTTATFGESGDNTVINKDGLTVTNGDKTVSLSDGGLNNGNNAITNVSSGLMDINGDKTDLANATATNAVNVGDLKETVSSLTDSTTGGFGLTDENGESVKADLGKTVTVKGDGSVTTSVVTATDGSKSLQVGLSDNVTVGVKGENGKDGVIGVNGKDGSAVVINGKDGSIGTTGADGKTGVAISGANGTIGINGKDGSNATITLKQGRPGVDGKDGENKTRIVYETVDKDGNPVTEEVATLKDGLKFAANSGDVHNAALNSRVNILGGSSNSDWTRFDNGENVMTYVNGNIISIGIAKNLVNLTSAAFGTVGDNTVINKDGITISNDNGNNVSLTENGLNNGNNQITNVASGLSGTTLADANGSTLSNAANIGDVKTAVEDLTGSGFGLTDQNGKDVKADLGKTVIVKGDGSVTTNVVNENGQSALQIGLSDNVTIGSENKAGTVTVKGENGKDGVVINGSDGSISLKDADGNESVALNGKDGTATFKDAQGNITVAINGQNGIIGVSGENGVNTTVGGNGVTIGNGANGTVSLTDKGLNNGNNRIINVASGLTDANGNATDLANATQTNAVNVGDLAGAQKGAVEAATWMLNTQGQADAGKGAQAVSNQTVTVNHGINTKVSEVKQTSDGGYSYEIDVTGLPMEYIDANGNSLVNVGGKFYTQSEGENGQLTLTPATPAKVRITSDAPMQLTNVAGGKIAADSTDAVNGAQLHSANQNIARHLGGGSTVDSNGNITAPSYITTDGNPSGGKTVVHNNAGDAIRSLNSAVTQPLKFTADKGSMNAKLGAAVSIKGDGKNITTAADENGVKISLKDNIEVTSVKAGNTTLSNDGVTIVNGPSLTTGGIDAGGKTVNNVADGELSATSRQAVNGSQLYATNQVVIRNVRNVEALNGRVDKLDKDISGVGASAAAMSSLPQAAMPGRNLVAVAGGTHRGQSAVALGLSRVSDNGKIILKVNAGHNSRGDSSVGMGVGYQW